MGVVIYVVNFISSIGIAFECNHDESMNVLKPPFESQMNQQIFPVTSTAWIERKKLAAIATWEKAGLVTALLE